MKDTAKQTGIAFILAEFRIFDERHIIPFETLAEALERANNGGRKSIAYEEVSQKRKIVRSKNGVPVDYLAALELLG